jgi:hypothetical protein
MTNLLALSGGTGLVGDYRIKRVLGAGGFGITYLADEIALARQVTIKEYFPVDYAVRLQGGEAVPRSQDVSGDYKWGLDRFIDEAKTLARFDHPNIVRVYRYFEANRTAYMVLRFEEGKSLKTWLKELGRAPRQAELDQIVRPLLDALDVIHKGDFLHRDIAPDNIMIRPDRTPVLIDFGSARGEIASHSRTVSALVKPGYSPYEQYATTTSQQGAWTDIYALGATLYHAVTGKRPPDAPSRIVKDEYTPAREAAIGSYRAGFLSAIDHALRCEPGDRPQSVAAWRGPLLAPDERAKVRAAAGRRAEDGEPEPVLIAAPAMRAGAAPPPPDVPSPPGRLLDYLDAVKGVVSDGKAESAQKSQGLAPQAAAETPRHGLGYGAPPAAGEPAYRPPAAGPAAEAGARSSARSAEVPVPLPIRRPSTPLWRRILFFTRSPWRGLLLKLAAGVAVASLAVSYQDQLVREGPPAQPVPQRTAALPPAQSSPQATPPPSPNAPQAQPRPAPAVVAPTAPEARVVTQLAGSRTPVLALSFLQQGRRVVATSTDGTLKIWDGDTTALARSLSVGEAPVAAAFATGQALAALQDGTLVILDTEKGERIAIARRAQAKLTAATFGDEPARTAAGTADGHVVVWDRSSAAPIIESEESHTGAVSVLRVVPGRSLFVSGGEDRTVRLWTADQATLERTYRGHAAPITALEAAPNGRAFASGGADGQIRVWSVSSSRTLRSFRGHKGQVNALAFTPAGDALASAGADGSIRIWDARRGRSLVSFVLKSGPARALAFSPDGKRLAMAGEDGIVRLWDVTALKSTRGD